MGFLSKNLSGVMLPVNADIPRDIDVFFVDEHDQHASKIGAERARASFATSSAIAFSAAPAGVACLAAVRSVHRS